MAQPKDVIKACNFYANHSNHFCGGKMLIFQNKFVRYLSVVVSQSVLMVCISACAFAGASSFESCAKELTWARASTAEVRSILPGVTVQDLVDATKEEAPSKDKVTFTPQYLVASEDLNQDGVREILLYRSGPGLCGSAGCELSVYQKSSKEFVNILGTPNSTIAASQNICVSDEVTEGFNHLLLNCKTTSKNCPVWKVHNGRYQ